MNIAMINPEPPRPKHKFPVSDQLFYNTITRKYASFKQPRLKYPSLIFLLPPTLQPTILQYFLLKNRNILPGNRNAHLQQHLDFVIRLFLHLAPPLPDHAAPASAAPTASAASPARAMMEKIYHLMNMSHPTPHPHLLFQSWVNHSYPTAFPRQITLPAESHHPVLSQLITTQFHQALSSQVVNAAFYQRALTFPGRNEIYSRSLPSKSQPGPVYINQRFFTNPNISNLNILIETTQKPVKEIQRSNTHTNTYTHAQPPTSTPASSQPALVTPGAAMLFPRLMTTHFYHTELTAPTFPGSTKIDGIHREPKSPVENQPFVPGPSIPGPRHQYQWFFHEGKTSNMFINANQRLLKKIDLRLPGKIEMSHPTTAGLALSGTADFYRTALTEHRFPGPGLLQKYLYAFGDQGALFEKTAPWTPTKAFVLIHGIQTGGRYRRLSGEQPGSAVPAHTSLFDTVVAKRLLTPLVHFKKISHEENTIIKKMTVEKARVNTHPYSFTQMPTELHHFNPLHRVENDLKEQGVIRGVTALDKNPEAAGFKGKSNVGGESPGIDGPGFSQNTAVNLNQLTDQVYRMLERKIRTEKERRGW